MCQRGVVCVLIGGPVYEIKATDKIWAFEMHPRLGPCVVHRVTQEPLTREPTKAFWRAWEQWDEAGRHLDGKLCVLKPETEEE